MPSAKDSAPGLKILMLHGYTQTGTSFHYKTRALEKLLQKTFPGTSLSYPTGPFQLRPGDIPGYDPSTVEDPDNIEAYGWWRHTSDTLHYIGLEQGLDTVAKVIEAEGPFDGIIGFSQGAALAAMVASLLEGDSRKQAFKKAQSRSPLAIPYPPSFERLDHPPLKFCVSYCGFVAPGDRYRGFYEDPLIQTPVCNVIGSLDSVVEEARTQVLVDVTHGPEKTHVVTHPGGHFVPSGKKYLEPVAAFIQQTVAPEPEQGGKEESVEDMDVPF